MMECLENELGITTAIDYNSGEYEDSKYVREFNNRKDPWFLLKVMWKILESFLDPIIKFIILGSHQKKWLSIMHNIQLYWI